MTATERAERIVEEWMFKEKYENPLLGIRDFIAAEIEAAYKQGYFDEKRDYEAARTEARREAILECAKIAEAPWDYVPVGEGKYAPLSKTGEEIAKEIGNYPLTTLISPVILRPGGN